MLRLLAALALLVLAPSHALALRIEGTAIGSVAAFAETAGRGSDVFGLDGAALVGQSARIDFAYDTALAPTPTIITASDGSRADYSTSDPAANWLSMSVTINGLTHDLVGNNRQADILDIVPIGPASHDHVQLSIEGSFESTDGSIFERQFLDMFLQLPEGTIDGVLLPDAFSSEAVISSGGGVSFRINELAFDGTGALVDERWVNFEIVVTDVSAAVPEPSAGLLTAVGFALWARRERSVSYSQAR